MRERQQSDGPGGSDWDEHAPDYRAQVFDGEELLCTYDDHPRRIREYAVRISKKFKRRLQVTVGPKPNDQSWAPKLPRSKRLWPHTVR